MAKSLGNKNPVLHQKLTPRNKQMERQLEGTHVQGNSAWKYP